MKLRKEWNVWFGLNMKNGWPAAYLYTHHTCKQSMVIDREKESIM